MGLERKGNHPMLTLLYLWLVAVQAAWWLWWRELAKDREQVVWDACVWPGGKDAGNV